jgi:hypothetical protein
MFKRFFLKKGMKPFSIGCLPLIGLFLIALFLGLWMSSETLLNLASFVLVVAVIWMVFCLTIEERYIVRSPSDQNFDFILKVKKGWAGEAGQRFWKEKGYKYPMVSLPKATNGVFKVIATFSHRSGRTTAEAQVSLLCHVPQNEETPGENVLPYGFDPPELYRYVIKGGYTSVYELIEHRLKVVTETNPAIKKAFKENPSDSSKLALALTKALKPVQVWLPLNNVVTSVINLRWARARYDAEMKPSPEELD